jgi:hypothetical protein
MACGQVSQCTGSLQLLVLRFGFLQDGDVGVGVFPEGRSPDSGWRNVGSLPVRCQSQKAQHTASSPQELTQCHSMLQVCHPVYHRVRRKGLYVPHGCKQKETTVWATSNSVEAALLFRSNSGSGVPVCMFGPSRAAINLSSADTKKISFPLRAPSRRASPRLRLARPSYHPENSEDRSRSGPTYPIHRRWTDHLART